MWQYDSWRHLLKDLLIVLLVSGTVGIALKFVAFQMLLNIYGTPAYAVFPYFPNLLDSAFLIITALTLAFFVYKRRNKCG